MPAGLRRSRDSPRARGRRVVAERNRTAIIEAASQLVRARSPLTMRAVATTAHVSRSTLYRHFANPSDLQSAIRAETLARIRLAGSTAAAGRRPLLAELRSVITALVGIGRRLPVELPACPPLEDELSDVGRALVPLARRLAEASDLDRAPADDWLLSGIAHFVGTCLRAGWSDPDGGRDTVERLFELITDPLDRGLLVAAADGTIVASNAGGRVGLADPAPGSPATVRDGGLYEDGSAAPPDLHPLSVALRGVESEDGVRGHRGPDGDAAWFSIEVRPLRRPDAAEPYGYVAVFTDVTDEHRFQLRNLRPPGGLGGTAVPVLDVVRVLDEVPPPLLPEQLIAEAMRIARGPVALYVLDIDGSHLLRLAGTEEFPERLAAPLALGPELAEDGLPALRARLAEELPGVVMAPMWLRGRAVGVLLARRGSEAGLGEVARLGAAAMELAGGYTDVFDDARRRKEMTPAAEIQQSLLPPRIVRVGSGELAGSVLPSYEVGGDWFDYVENRDGTWIAIADGAGRGPHAAGLASVTLAALRAARRSGASLDEAARLMDETVAAAGGPTFFVTAILARWNPVYSLLSWINLGHPPPLLVAEDGRATELATTADPPLGITERARPVRRHQRQLSPGDRLVMYTDGISRRRTADGAFDTDGIAAAVRGTDAGSATAAARAIQEGVVSASEDPLPDDAAVVVLSVSSSA